MQADLTHGSVNAETVSADFFTRLVAYIIDAVIIGVPIFVLMLILPMILSYMVGMVLGIGYLVYFWSTTGQTFGKKIMGLKVVSADTGDIITARAAGLRYVGYLISGLAFYLGFLWIIWDPHHDGWHDKIAATKVIKVS